MAHARNPWFARHARSRRPPDRWKPDPARRRRVGRGDHRAPHPARPLRPDGEQRPLSRSARLVCPRPVHCALRHDPGRDPDRVRHRRCGFRRLDVRPRARRLPAGSRGSADGGHRRRVSIICPRLWGEGPRVRTPDGARGALPDPGDPHRLAAEFFLPCSRGSAIRWSNLRRGAFLSVLAAVVGFSPWIIYNAQTRLGSLRHLYTPLTTYGVPTDQAFREVLAIALPIFVGARVNYCGPSIASTTAVDLALLLLGAAVLWNRRHVLAALARRQFAAIEPVDIIVLIGPLAVIAVTVKWFNALSCEPRYLMPLAVPLVTAVVLLLGAGWLLRGAAAAFLLALLAISVITAQREAALIHDLVIVPGAPSVRVGWPALATRLESERPQAVWANYWLARPVEYVSGDRIVVGEYGGYVAFPEIQSAALAAPHPSWLFMPGSTDIPVFEQACAKRGITYRRLEVTDGLILYADLSQRLEPADVRFQTQSVSQAN